MEKATKHFNCNSSGEGGNGSGGGGNEEKKSISSMFLYSVSGSLDDSSIGFSGTISLKDGMKASNEEWASIVNSITWSISDTSIVDHITCQWPESLGETSSLSLIMGVTPKKPGTATITGTLPDGSQVTCTITVNAANAVNDVDPVDAAANAVNTVAAVDAVSAVNVVHVIEEVDIADVPTLSDVSQNVLANAYTGTIDTSDTRKTASFTGLASNKLYVILAVRQADAEDLLAADNLLYIAQGYADASGNLALEYIPRTDDNATALAYEYKGIKKPSDSGGNDEDLLPNSITASNITVNANASKAQTISIKAKAKGGSLTYQSNNGKIKVDSAGIVTVPRNYAGKAAITITASGGEFETATQTITVTVKQIANKITASDITKVYSKKAQAFSIKAKRKGKGKLTYSSNNRNITVSQSGKVKIKAKYIGKAVITVKVKASGIYKAASKKVTVKVNPAGTKILRHMTWKSKKLNVSWKRDSAATGYQIQYSTSKKFKKAATKTKTVKKNSTTKLGIGKLKEGRSYYLRIRTYKTVSGKKYYSDWSTVWWVKI